jgi:hypothetical protein
MLVGSSGRNGLVQPPVREATLPTRSAVSRPSHSHSDRSLTHTRARERGVVTAREVGQLNRDVLSSPSSLL